MKNPCYDEELKRDCPDRCVGCAVNCERWAEYVRIRDAEYADRLDDYNARSACFSVKEKREAARLERRIRDRQRITKRQ